MDLQHAAVRDRIGRLEETADALRWEQATARPRFAALRRAAGRRLVRAGFALAASAMTRPRLRPPGLPVRQAR